MYLLGGFLSLSIAGALQIREGHGAHKETEGKGTSLRGSIFHGMNHLASEPPCQCKSHDAAWTPPAPRPPRCLFFDLGAHNGDTYQVFLGQHPGGFSYKYDTGSFNKTDCEVWLVEGNPKFEQSLKSLSSSEPVHPMVPTAAYMCDTTSKFYVDLDESDAGSSVDVHKVNNLITKEIEVPFVNFMRLLTTTAREEDTVVVKMDIEGAEYDIVPCLAKSPAARLIDNFYVEQHWHKTNGIADNSLEDWAQALNELRAAGVNVPDYSSPMM